LIKLFHVTIPASRPGLKGFCVLKGSNAGIMFRNVCLRIIGHQTSCKICVKNSFKKPLYWRGLWLNCIEL